MRKRENKKLIQHYEFNSYAEAKDMVAASEKRLKRILIGLAIAAVSSCMTAYALFANPANPEFFYAPALLLGFLSYIIGGGFGKAFHAAKKLAVFGWFVVPVFPVDLFLMLATVPIAIFCFFMFPVVFVFLNYLQNKADYQDAKKYLSYCTPASTGSEQI